MKRSIPVSKVRPAGLSVTTKVSSGGWPQMPSHAVSAGRAAAKPGLKTGRKAR